MGLPSFHCTHHWTPTSRGRLEQALSTQETESAGTGSHGSICRRAWWPVTLLVSSGLLFWILPRILLRARGMGVRPSQILQAYLSAISCNNLLSSTVGGVVCAFRRRP